MIADITEYPRFAEFYARLESKPMTRFFIPRLRLFAERYGDEYLDLAERCLEVCARLKWDAVKIAARFGYEWVQMQSKKTQDKTLDGIYSEVYSNDGFMAEKYYPEIFVQNIIVPYKVTLYHFYKTSFLPRLETGLSGVEVGFGEGFFLWDMLRHIPGLKLHGFDISPASVEVAAKLLREAGVEDAELSVGDVTEGLPVQDGAFDFGLMVNVLGKLNEPEKALREMHRVLKPGGLFYCNYGIGMINYVDVLSAFADTDEFSNTISRIGFSIVEQTDYRYKDDFDNSLVNTKSVAVILKREQKGERT